MEVLTKDMITRWTLPHLPARTGGRRVAADPVEVVGAICYKLKTGCQWRWLPVNALFTGEPLSWQGVYYHFKAWGKFIVCDHLDSNSWATESGTAGQQ